MQRKALQFPQNLLSQILQDFETEAGLFVRSFYSYISKNCETFLQIWMTSASHDQTTSWFFFIDTSLIWCSFLPKSVNMVNKSLEALPLMWCFIMNERVTMQLSLQFVKVDTSVSLPSHINVRSHHRGLQFMPYFVRSGFGIFSYL